MNNEPNEIDNIDTVVGFWAIDESLEKIRGLLKKIADICEPERNNDVD
jgi:hypothetical protein